jgi:hypothetical protein
MMTDAAADQKIGVLAEGLPGTLDVTVQADGRLQKLSAKSLVGLRVDYRVNGQFAKAVLFHGPLGGVDLFDRAGQSTLPWGLTPSVEIVAVPDLARFQVALKQRAPAGWTGTAHLTFLLRNAGADTRVKFTVRGAQNSAG